MSREILIKMSNSVHPSVSVTVLVKVMAVLVGGVVFAGIGGCGDDGGCGNSGASRVDGCGVGLDAFCGVVVSDGVTTIAWIVSLL